MTSARERFRAEHPDFPLLAVDDLPGTQAFLEARGWLEPGERVRATTPAGEGNMNLTLRVDTDRRAMVLKQARPWVEKYDFIPAPWERATMEASFYERIAAIPEVASKMPRLIASDASSRALLIELIEPAMDFSSLYAGGDLELGEAEVLARFLAGLHRSTWGDADPRFRNLAMRELNHQHIYVIPLTGGNGIDLERFEPGLGQVAADLREDRELAGLMAETGQHYMGSGPCLLHGDFFPGSWLRTPNGPRVLDPEFCFHGPQEFDVGNFVAHMLLAQQDAGITRHFLATYCRDPQMVEPDYRWVTRFAAAEVIRRLLGVAQLPLPPSQGWRASSIERAVRAFKSKDLEALLT